jgi:hypothetical protein
MKTPKQYYDDFWGDSHYHEEYDIKYVIEMAQTEAYNQGVRDAAEKVFLFSNNLAEKVHAKRIKESILKLLKP